MRFFLTVTISFIFSLSILTAAAAGPEDARQKLDQMKVAYNENTFVERARDGDIQVIKMFLQAGMDPNVAADNGNTALIAAVRASRPEIINLLLTEGADINRRDKEFGAIPLIWAALRGHNETANLLLERGADINALEEKNGMNAVSLAAFKGHT